MSDRVGTITSAIEQANGHAIGAYLTAGYPTLEEFPAILQAVAGASDLVEVGVPFTDPMADGQTVQKASHVALTNGVDLDYIFDALMSANLDVPHVLMGYYNPFLAYRLERLVERMADVGTAGLIVPDLPLEESGDLVASLKRQGQGLIQLVAPTTPDERLRTLAEESKGFVYAVTTKGTTGRATDFNDEVLSYLDRVKAASALPVLAGFGVRERAHLEALSGHVDGAVVGSALINAIDSGVDPVAFIDGLRPLEVG